jgi:tetratricopeptide (TPR) repeat protein
MLLHTRVYAGELEQLAKEVRTARELLPSDPVVQCMYGVVLASEGVEDNVEALLRGGLERQSMQPICRVSLGGLLTRQGKEQQAVELYEEEISLFPPALSARQALVSLYATQRLHKQQLSQLREIQSIEPGNFLTSHSAAQALYNLERYEDAWVEVEQCRKLAPRYPACAMLAANILKRRGKSAQAQKAYEEALRLAERDGG